MGNPKPIECAQCIQSMAHAKGELLTRIACANCQYAQELTENENLQRERSSRLRLISRCPECGKWCWTRTSLAIHREVHRAAETKTFAAVGTHRSQDARSCDANEIPPPSASE
jgi:ribosomal protein S27AE